MLCVKPSDNAELKNEILSSVDIIGDSPELLTATENEKLLGYAAVDPVGRTLRLAKIEISDCKDYANPTAEDMELAEYLVRAAGNYAYNRLMTTLSCENDGYKAILKPFGFKEIDNKFQLDIKVLFKKCENCSAGY